MLKKLCSIVLFTCFCMWSLAAQQVFCAKIPGYTGYALPSQDGVEFHDQYGCIQWTNPDIVVQYHMQIEKNGEIGIRLMMSNDGSTPATISLRFADISKELKVPPSGGKEKYVMVDAGMFEVPYPGFYTVRIKPLTKSGAYYPGIMNVQMYSAYADKVYFSRLPDRNSSAVQLTYSTPKEDMRGLMVSTNIPKRFDSQGTRITVVGNEMMRAGLGSEKEGKYIYFTWKNIDKYSKPTLQYTQYKNYHLDSSNPTQTRLVIPYNWTPDQLHSLTIVQNIDTCTKMETWEAMIYNEKKKKWNTIGIINIHGASELVKEWYSGISNPDANSGYVERKAFFSSPIAILHSGSKKRLSKASFRHDIKGKKDRKDYGAGVDAEMFWLSTGGFSFPQTSYGKSYEIKPKTTTTNDEKLLVSF